ncbi:MAG: HAD family hydrolase [Gaiellaceae bacterium]
MTTPRALIFDFNGTLSHDEPILCATYQAIFAEHGRQLSSADYYGQLAGHTEEEIISTWLGVDGAELEELVAERVRRYVTAAADGSTVEPPVREAVRYAAERVPVAICSGAFREEIAPVLEGAGIASLFTAVVADDVTSGKPHPEGYLRAVALLGDGLEPGRVVAFEDTEAGVAAAKDAGLRCLAVRGTLPDERLARADELVDGIDLALVQSIVG